MELLLAVSRLGEHVYFGLGESEALLYLLLFFAHAPSDNSAHLWAEWRISDETIRYYLGHGYLALALLWLLPSLALLKKRRRDQPDKYQGTLITTMFWSPRNNKSVLSIPARLL